ncbi:MAG: 16S rRNA (uracil(1498)-N(3))-methyltransferase [Oscillospiraceae bacterium]|nr:16S rRNA (uracil(1498)-N(3))-methyltransferase [Oscillospiraceae bacterium]
MPHFFVDEEIITNEYTLSGEDGRHIIKSLRMNKGEELTLCSPSGTIYNCVVENTEGDMVDLSVISREMSVAEPDVKVTLYQALPKGDKMELIIQKSVEIGVTEIVPVISSRCVSRPDKKSLSKKIPRWQKIAKQAAMQSGRGIIPKVQECISFKEAVLSARGEKVIFYELGGDSLKSVLESRPKEISIFIGSEGGFSSEEVSLVTDNDGRKATLGKRILRAETAPLVALTTIMYETENME